MERVAGVGDEDSMRISIAAGPDFDISGGAALPLTLRGNRPGTFSGAESVRFIFRPLLAWHVDGRIQFSGGPGGDPLYAVKPLLSWNQLPQPTPFGQY